MAKRKTVTKVGKLLHEAGLWPEAFTTQQVKKGAAKGVMNETYGDDSRIYLCTGSEERRKQIEDFLEQHGVKVSRSYWPGSGVVDVRVSYFKGWHWDE